MKFTRRRSSKVRRAERSGCASWWTQVRRTRASQAPWQEPSGSVPSASSTSNSPTGGRCLVLDDHGPARPLPGFRLECALGQSGCPRLDDAPVKPRAKEHLARPPRQQDRSALRDEHGVVFRPEAVRGRDSDSRDESQGGFGHVFRPTRSDDDYLEPDSGPGLRRHSRMRNL